MSERLTDERLAGRKLYLESIAIVPLARDVSGEISIIAELLALRARNAKLEAVARYVDELVFYDPKDDWRSHGMDKDFQDRVEQKKNEIYQRGDMLTIYISEGDWVMLRATAHFALAIPAPPQ